MGENSELFLFPIKARFPYLKAGSIREVYIFPMAGELSTGRILNTNLLHDIVPLLYTEKLLFF